MQYIFWPSAFVIVAIFFICKFAPQIAEIITRIRKVGPTGARISPRTEKQSIEQQTSAVSVVQSTERLLKAFDSPAIQQREQAIRLHLQAERLDDSGQTVTVLVRHLAHIQIAWHCELIYRLIFGSQIAFLKGLNSSGPVSESAAIQLYRHVHESLPDLPEDHHWFYQFLTAQGLVRFEQQSFVITDMGREFLQ